MGSIFTNVHVHAPEGREPETRQRVVDHLTAEAKRQGMLPCEDGADADRSIVVGPVARWIGVFDEATESQRLEPLDALAAALSEATGEPAVAALVHDSDTLLLRLFDRGERIDAIERGGKPKGDAARWSSVCGPRLAEMRAALEREDLFKEQTLAEIAGVLGIDPKSACTGYRYLVQDDEVPPGSVMLRFRSAERPAHEKAAEGPPRFVAAAWSPTLEVPVGGALHVGASVRNEGGGTRGLMIAVHGPAIEADLVAPERVQVVVGMPREGGVSEQPFEQRILRNGKPGFVAELPELAIPAGAAGGMEALAGLDPRKLMERMHASNVHANVLGRVQSAGRAPLHLSFVPLSQRDAQLGYAVDLTVLAAPRKPLRATGDARGWMALEKPEALVAFAVSTLAPGEAAPLAAEALEQWSGLWSKDLVLSCAMHDAINLERPTKPRSATLRVDKMPTSAAWKKLRAALGTAAHVSGTCTTPLESAQMRRRMRGLRADGFDFGGHLIASTQADDPDLPTLRLSLDLDGFDDAGVASALARARSIVDDFVRRARCAQAFVARWQPSSSLDTTAYESACGVHQQAPLRRSWGTRFLRGVSADGMWLGPALLARVDRGALDALVISEPMGDAVRITPRDGVTLDALEAVLAPVLPSGEDWQRWMSWIYGRGERPT